MRTQAQRDSVRKAAAVSAMKRRAAAEERRERARRDAVECHCGAFGLHRCEHADGTIHIGRGHEEMSEPS